ncbi:DNA repair protein RecO, partial [Saccharopolyspora kobensis]
ARREGSGLIAAHLQWHMERQLRSLPLVERTVPELIRERAAEAALVGTAEDGR